MALTPLHARIVRVEQLTHNVRELRLELIDPPTVTFRAGQYVMFGIPASGDKAANARAYSICSAPHEETAFHLVANLVPGGEGSRYFFGLKVGDEVRLRGPTGHFILDEQTTRDYLFVATGTGIAPIRSMLLDAIVRGVTRQMTLLWGLRAERDIYYMEEFRALARRQPNFQCHLTLSQPQPDWKGLKGRVTAVAPELIASATNLDVYLCGSQAMIHDMKTVLRTKGLCPIHTEKFY